MIFMHIYKSYPQFIPRVILCLFGRMKDMKTRYITKSHIETQQLGKELAQEILKRNKGKQNSGAFVIGLRGDLGGGKTTFLQGCAKGLGIKENILSPTYVILKRYGNFYHIDCYRIKNAKDILALGFEEIITKTDNIVAIEWVEKIKDILPKNTLWIDFEFKEENKRVVLFDKA